MERFEAFLERNGFDAKDYQREGVEWMLDLETDGCMMGNKQIRGGILADEMGLGKTVQVCALLKGAHNSGATHSLLLLPRRDRLCVVRKQTRAGKLVIQTIWPWRQTL